MHQLILHIRWCSEGQTSSDQLDWGQYVVYTRKQVPSLKEDNQWLYIKMHWLFLLCWFSDCIFILLCCLQYCISSLCLWTRNVSGVGNAFSDSNEVCYIAALIASGNVSPDYNSGLSQLIPPDKCSLTRKKYLKILTQHPNTNSSTCTFSHSRVVFVGLYIYLLRLGWLISSWLSSITSGLVGCMFGGSHIGCWKSRRVTDDWPHSPRLVRWL